jgi:hypothetical protein
MHATIGDLLEVVLSVLMLYSESHWEKLTTCGSGENTFVPLRSFETIASR